MKGRGFQWRARWLAAAAVATAAALTIAGNQMAAWRERRGLIDRSRTYAIGTDNTYPYHYMTEKGEVEGMVAEVVNEAARRAGIRLEWRLRPEGPFRALTDYRVDLWPLLSVAPFDKSLHYSRPYLRNSYVLLTAGMSLSAMGGEKTVRRLTLVGYPLVIWLGQQEFPGAAQVSRRTRAEALSALCQGEADGMLTEARTAQFLALLRPRECDGKALYADGMNLPSTQLAIASVGASPADAVCDLLRDEMDAMTSDGTTADLLRRWNYYYSGEAEAIYQEMKARSATRVSMALAGALGVFAILLLVLLIRMRIAQRAAVAANTAKSQFLAHMSHEIRTPLHGIIGLTRMLGETRLQEEQQQFVDLISRSGETLLNLVNDVLDLARIERGRLQLHDTEFDLKLLVSECVRVFHLQAGERGVALTLTGAETLPERVVSDEAALRQVLTNLMANAVKFTERGFIRVAANCKLSGGQALLQFTIQDSGIGIRPEHQRIIFERFQQADPTISSRFGGTGLGLAISREIVTAMGGRIGVESGPGVGSTFWFTAPVRLASGGKSLAALAHSVRTEPPAATAPRALLLVEDNPINQRIARSLLEKAGHVVTTVGDGESAIRVWQSGRFDAIFMDCHMPGMDGYQVTAEIRRLEGPIRKTPIIALTAAAMHGERERALSAGMDDFLAKPIELSELGRVLGRWVQPQQQAGVARPTLQT